LPSAQIILKASMTSHLVTVGGHTFPASTVLSVGPANVWSKGIGFAHFPYFDVTASHGVFRESAISAGVLEDARQALIAQVWPAPADNP
jgi:hypothetical protein